VQAANIAAGAVGSAQLASGLTLSGTTTISGNLNLPATTSATTGVIEIGGTPFLQAYGAFNTFVGQGAGNFTMTGLNNTASGYNALNMDTDGRDNTASGTGALAANNAGSYNTASGAGALFANTTGDYNTALGAEAMYTQSFSNAGNEWSSNNVAVGYHALNLNQPTATTNGINNTAVGTTALSGNTTGANNIALGNNAGSNLTTGNNNIDIGNVGVAAESNIIRIGTSGTQTSTFIAGISGVTVSGGAPVSILSNGQLGTITSSRRFKIDIADMNASSECLLSLRPVTFRYKPEIDPPGHPPVGPYRRGGERSEPRPRGAR